MPSPTLRELDDKIRQAMRADPALADPMTEEGVFEMLAQVFRGRRRWLNLYGFVLTFAFFILSVYCAVQFFGAVETQPQIAWATGFLFTSMAVAMLKLWFWMEMQKNTVLREIKRLELQMLRAAKGADR